MSLSLNTFLALKRAWAYLKSELSSLLFKLQGISLCVPDTVTHTLNVRTSENLGILSSPPSAGYNTLVHLRPGLHISVLRPPPWP